MEEERTENVKGAQKQKVLGIGGKNISNYKESCRAESRKDEAKGFFFFLRKVKKDVFSRIGLVRRCGLNLI